MMKKIILLFIAVVLAYGFIHEQGLVDPGISKSVHNSDGILQDAYNKHKSNIQIQGEGVVAKVLPDDRQGSRHQRFIIRLGTGQTLIVAHNIDIAPRIRNLKAGDRIAFSGEYKWNSRGGVIHWTHHNPNGRHQGGWLKHNGSIYQ